MILSRFRKSILPDGILRRRTDARRRERESARATAAFHWAARNGLRPRSNRCRPSGGRFVPRRVEPAEERPVRQREAAREKNQSLDPKLSGVEGVIEMA